MNLLPAILELLEYPVLKILVSLLLQKYRQMERNFSSKGISNIQMICLEANAFPFLVTFVEW